MDIGMAVEGLECMAVPHAYPKGPLAEHLRAGQLVKGPDNGGKRSENLRKRKAGRKRRQRNGTIQLRIPWEYDELEENEDLRAEERTLFDAPGPIGYFEMRALQSPSLSSSPSTDGAVSPFRALSSISRSRLPVRLLVDHYLENMAVPIPALDQGSSGLLRSKWFPMAFTEPATLHVIVLTSASHYLSSSPRDVPVFHLHSATTPASIVLDLKQQTLHLTNLLLRDSNPGRRTSDAALAAVAKLASYEAMFGDGNAFTTHMSGLSRMLALRGGFRELDDALDGLLLRMILWIDANAAFLLGRPAWFEADEVLSHEIYKERIQSRPAPDMARFLGFD